MKLRATVGCAILAAAFLSPKTGLADSPIASSAGCVIQAQPVYDGQGAAMPGVSTIVPPRTFNPLTASGSELACYGFPQRPADPDKQAGWIDAMRSYKRFVAPIVGKPMQTGNPGVQPYNQCSGCYFRGSWAGYSVWASKNTSYPSMRFTEISADWNVPATHNCQNNYSIATWVGIGGDDSTTDIIQAGVESFWNSAYGCAVKFVYENAPSHDTAPIPFFGVSEGDSVYVDVSYAPSTNQATYFVEDTTKGTTTSLTESNIQYQGNSAEAVLENPNGIHGYISTVNFSNFLVSASYSAGTTTGWFWAYNDVKRDLGYNGTGGICYQSGAINTGSSGFPVTYIGSTC